MTKARPDWEKKLTVLAPLLELVVLQSIALILLTTLLQGKPITVVTPDQLSPKSSPFRITNQEAELWLFRGTFSAQFRIPKAGSYTATITYRTTSPTTDAENPIFLEAQVASQVSERVPLSHSPTRTTTATLSLGFIQKGVQNLNLLVDNYDPSRRFFLHQVEVHKDSDKAPLRLISPSTSAVSPACVEAISRFPPQLKSQPFHRGEHPTHWYKTIPLLPDGPTTITLQSPLHQDLSQTITWLPTELGQEKNLTIPLGASLKIALPNLAPGTITCGNLRNWSLQPDAVATQSSTQYDGFASEAIDGNFDPTWDGGSLTHTHREQEGLVWWQVDLGNPRSIEKIVLHNRKTGRRRLQNYIIKIYHEDQLLRSQKFHHEDPDNFSKDTEIWALVSPCTADRVRIERLGPDVAGENVLSLAEVEVLGHERLHLTQKSPVQVYHFSESRNYYFTSGTHRLDVEVLPPLSLPKPLAIAGQPCSLAIPATSRYRWTTGPDIHLSPPTKNQSDLTFTAHHAAFPQLLARCPSHGSIISTVPFYLARLTKPKPHHFSSPVRNDYFPNQYLRSLRVALSGLPAHATFSAELAPFSAPTLLGGADQRSGHPRQLRDQIFVLHLLSTTPTPPTISLTAQLP